MHTVAMTRAFERAARDAGMSTVEIDTLISFLAANPMAGDEIQGTGGCRKLRVAGRGKGKSGGYRVITFFSGPMIPVFLLTMFSKGERANLSEREKGDLRKVTEIIVNEYKQRVRRVGKR